MHDDRPIASKSILKKPVQPHQSPQLYDHIGDRTSTERLKSLAGQLSRLCSASQRETSAFAPTQKRAPDSTQHGSKYDLDGCTIDGRGLATLPKRTQCDACAKPLEKNEGCVLQECQQHVICKTCLRVAVEDSREFGQKPLCPVQNCCAVIKTPEIGAILSEGRAERIPTEEKIPGSSTLDDSTALPIPEKPPIPRQPAVITNNGDQNRCDKCREPVDTVGYLDIRKCKLKHRICFECIRNAVRISKTLVRCPLYRECKSMMSRDEVLQARYDIKAANDPRDRATPKSKATCQYIYPNGLPNADLWPVLQSAKCSKCGCGVDVLNGIVIKQCNMHSVCVQCVRQSLVANNRVVKCPMYTFCKSCMLDEEVEAFKSRFGI